MTTPAGPIRLYTDAIARRSARAGPAKRPSKGQDIGEMAEPPAEAALEA